MTRLATRTDVRLEGRVAMVQVTERFDNRGATLGEADYVFPLPDGAAFDDLRLEVNGELVAGEVLSADSARATYERIVRTLRDPALVEWAGRGLVRTRIFPFRAGERRTVVVRYRQLLARDGDAVRLTGRLVGAGDVPRDGDELAEGRFVLRYPAGAYGTPWSPTHTVRRLPTDTEGRAGVRLSGTDGDVIAYVPLRRDRSAPTLTVLPHAAPDGDGDGHVLVLVSPPQAPARVRPRDVTFLVDVSGSMRGGKLEQARAAGRALLATLGANDRVRLVAFGDEVEGAFSTWMPATPDVRRRAGRWLDDLEAAGGTNIAGAMQAALGGDAAADPARVPLVLLLTDGRPTVGLADGRALADSVRVWRQDVRVHTVGIGADVDATLLETMALDGGGVAHFVRPEESVERVVSLAASRLTDPLLTDVHLEADGVRLRQLHAAGPRDLHAGQELVFLARYRGSGAGRLRLVADAGGRRYTASARVRWPARDSAHGFVPRLWAVQRIAALSAERRRHGADPERDQELRELGERYGLPTPLTSYLATEPGMRVADVPTGERQRGIGGGTARAMPAIARAAGGGQVIAEAATPARRDGGAASVAADEFEAARNAAELRRATSVAAADAVVRASVAGAGVGADAVRVVRGVVFIRRGETWTDRRLQQDSAWRPMWTVRVQPYSRAWRALAREVPALRDVLALGEAVVARGRTVRVEVAADGATVLDAPTVAAVRAGW